jgi:hypothetical protein
MTFATSIRMNAAHPFVIGIVSVMRAVPSKYPVRVASGGRVCWSTRPLRHKRRESQLGSSTGSAVISISFIGVVFAPSRAAGSRRPVLQCTTNHANGAAHQLILSGVRFDRALRANGRLSVR